MFLILTVPQIAFQKDIRQQRTPKKPFSSEQGDCSFHFTQKPFASSMATVLWARLYLQTNTKYTVVWDGEIFLQRHVKECINTMK